ncbi:DoxX family protein [Chitinophaga agrisoli]|nr:DoxX family protein [Chitinophaga agrisoli]
MKKDKIIYWTATGIVSAVMVFSIINFNIKNPVGPEVYRIEGPFHHLGLPDYMRIELTIAKALGVLALLIPGIPVKIKEFAYFGFAITLISASVAHFSSGDGIMFIIDPLIFLCVLTVSYWYFGRIRRQVHYR